MSLNTLHNEPHEVYFCTITCYKWLPLIEESNTYNSVYRWFRHLKADGCHIIGYVIMPNHLHVLLYMSHNGTSLNQLVSEGKRFMAYDIINGLKRANKTMLLNELSGGVSAREKMKGKKHQVFRLSFDARLCHSEWMLEQKLDYIHHNPVRGKWNLVDDFVVYQHSSAAFYEFGKTSDILITHYKELGCFDLTRGDGTR